MRFLTLHYGAIGVDTTYPAQLHSRSCAAGSKVEKLAYEAKSGWTHHDVII
jgi:hypothetical protein